MSSPVPRRNLLSVLVIVFQSLVSSAILLFGIAIGSPSWLTHDTATVQETEEQHVAALAMHVSARILILLGA